MFLRRPFLSLAATGLRPCSRAASAMSAVTGMAPGPFEVGVTTMQFDDTSRKDADGSRKLQTEIWYPAESAAAGLPRNLYSDYLGRGTIPGSIAAAEADDAIGGYRDGLTIAELDRTWPNQAIRDARPCGACKRPWPLVIFSHGSGAFRASYIYWTEFLASHGFCVMACDHPGSARYTQIDGKVVKPGGARSKREQMETDRPTDMLFLIDAMEALAGMPMYMRMCTCTCDALSHRLHGGAHRWCRLALRRSCGHKSCGTHGNVVWWLFDGSGDGIA